MSHNIIRSRQRLTRQSYVDALVNHPPGAVIEFPMSGVSHGEAVAHIFELLGAKWVHPKDNVQYSLGDRHGGHADVRCHLLTNAAGESPVVCYQTMLSCQC
jgi:hypothetical protein